MTSAIFVWAQPKKTGTYFSSLASQKKRKMDPQCVDNFCVERIGIQSKEEMNNVMYMHGEMENISTILMALGIVINDYKVYQISKQPER